MKISQWGRLLILCGLSALSAMVPPIIPLDSSKCGTTDVPVPPATNLKIVDFKLPSSSTPMRVRPTAHLVDSE
ncbi:hypothetical protein FRX31_028725 [Thalictrum thalictroides]|uniref:Transmembrane protein n=1 Tax=Thalictrum thalictroides TaxID=46969 RepID=A0A7J6VAI8_THATH|nr:hypothetical protein FRX31_028725 [Thalictrum thalictroides]